ncbi:hypothetical protein MKX01_021336, partial [Papaver californicum]
MIVVSPFVQSGKGTIFCIEKDLAQSEVSREDVNYVNAHATSTQTGDMKEYQSIIRCFCQNPDLRVNSTKSMIGHLLGAAGDVEVVALVHAIRTGWVHPNVNLENLEEGVVWICQSSIYQCGMTKIDNVVQTLSDVNPDVILE